MTLYVLSEVVSISATLPQNMQFCYPELIWSGPPTCLTTNFTFTYDNIKLTLEVPFFVILLWRCEWNRDTLRILELPLRNRNVYRLNLSWLLHWLGLAWLKAFSCGIWSISCKIEQRNLKTLKKPWRIKWSTHALSRQKQHACTNTMCSMYVTLGTCREKIRDHKKGTSHFVNKKRHNPLIKSVIIILIRHYLWRKQKHKNSTTRNDYPDETIKWSRNNTPDIITK